MRKAKRARLREKPRSKTISSDLSMGCYPILWEIANCAAASRATGTRNGEQET